jgi:cytochrome c-type biogenesis protein CcmF
VIVELGHFALVVALALAIAQGTLPLVGAQRHDLVLMRLGSTSAVAQFGCVTIAFAALTWAFVSSDFSVINVYQNSHDAKPLIYKISGVWGNHEGSLVLWVWILALCGAAVAWYGRNLPLPFKARALAIQGLIGVAFLLFLLLTSNPFERLDPAPLEGQGLNPILQDPGLAFHPPMLYLGYVGLSVTFAFAMAALIEGRVDASWARWVRPWTLAAWVALTAGIALGSWWAYYELGWGGWWFWDPVENASFMPWLAATALLHSAIVVEKRDTLKAWTILLAIVAFSLSLLGTFLVRSGVLTSVHAFAVDPDRGTFILYMLIIAIGGALALFAWRAPALQAGGAFAPVSREGGLLLNNLLLATATATVLLGTLYPLALEVVGGAKISVGPPFYNATFVPLMLPLLIAVPIGAMLAWKRGNVLSVLGRLKLAMAATLATAILTFTLLDVRSLGAAFGFALAAWLVFGALDDLRTKIGLFQVPLPRAWQRLKGLPASAFAVSIAHGGLGIMIVGMVATSTLQTERILTMRPGDTTTIGSYDVHLASIGEVEGPNWMAIRAVFETAQNGRQVADIVSEKRFYPVEAQSTTQVGLHTSFWRDLYFVLGDQTPDGAWAVRLYINPMAAWLWWGVGIMSLGGLVSLFDRRLRVGAPTTATAHRGKAAAPPGTPPATPPAGGRPAGTAEAGA